MANGEYLTGLTITNNGLAIVAGGANITGDSVIAGSLSGLLGLTLASGTLTIPNASTLALGTSSISGTPTWASSQNLVLATAAQPNITSLGILSGLEIAGHLTFSGGTRHIWTSDANGLQIGTNATAIITLTSGGGMQVGGPTGGDQGAGALNVASLFVNGSAVGGQPVGSISAVGFGTTDPTNGFLCEGRAISRTTYANLFSKIGTTYGEGDGSTTFNIPDFRSRIPMGADNMGTTAGAASRTSTNNLLGNTSGEDTHTLTGAESGTSIHGHTASTTGIVPTATNLGGAGSGAVNGWVGAAVTVNNASAANASSAHNNRQLNQVANWVIWY